MSEIYKHYFDELPCYVTVQDKDFRIIEANKKFRNDFGDYKDRYCYQVYKNQPEKCEICPVEKTFLDGNPHQSEEFVKTVQGNDVSVIVNTTPIRNEKGEITAVMEMSTDITQLKNLHDQLRTSQEKYRLLFEKVPCYISIQDRELNVVETNRMHRETFGTFYGCKCYKVYKHRDKACHPCIVRDTFQDGEIHVHEEVVTGQNGKAINVMVTTAPLRNADNEIEHVMEMSADITQIRKLQSKLSSTGMIISTISHDLKGLLNGLDGGIYLVNTAFQKDNKERLEKGWEMVQRNVGQIRSTVLDILYYAKDRKPDWENVSSEELITEIYTQMRHKAKDHNIEFSHVKDELVGQFEGDRKAIKSMLVNLIDNAFDACRFDGQKPEHHVSVRLTGCNDNVCFEISDNGIGMSQEIKEKAFTLFFSSKGSGGTGLGMFIANKIAQAHGGTIEVESDEGTGTQFRIILPRVKPDNAVELIDELEEDIPDEK